MENAASPGGAMEWLRDFRRPYRGHSQVLDLVAILLARSEEFCKECLGPNAHAELRQ